MAAHQYHRFNDPFGLALRLLRSGQREALWGLALPALQLMAMPVDVMTAAVARRLSSQSPSVDGKALAYPIVLIIGAPRSGTTLVHQVLARHLDVSYFNNAINLFPRSSRYIGKLFSRGGGASRIAYRSHYGSSARLSGPNDGFSIWNHWLGADRYAAPEVVSPANAQDLRAFFEAWFSGIPKPFLNKNNRNVDCAHALSEILPEAVFVEVRRNPMAVAQSLLRARDYIQGDLHRPWGLHSDKFSVPEVDPVEQVCKQIGSISQRLEAVRTQIDGERYRTIEYEAFCADPAGHVLSLQQSIAGLRLRETPHLDELKPFVLSSKATPETKAASEQRRRVSETLRSLGLTA